MKPSNFFLKFNNMLFLSFVLVLLLWILVTFKLDVLGTKFEMTAEQLVTLTGALFSAPLIMQSYLLKNLSFIESQKPVILIFVDLPGSIHYINKSSIPFTDLKINAIVSFDGKEFDLGSKVFSNPTHMSGHDSRQTPTIEHLLKTHFQVDNLPRSGATRLELDYSFAIFGEKQNIKLQSYVLRQDGWNLE